MLNLEFSSKSRKFLKILDKVAWERITEKIKFLQEDPFPTDAKRVVGRKEKTFRIRVGDYRILYVVFFNEKLLFISKVDKRSRVFKKD